MFKWYKNRKKREAEEIECNRITSVLIGELPDYVIYLDLLGEQDSTVALPESNDAIETFYRRGRGLISKLLGELQTEGNLSEEEARKRLASYISGLERIDVDTFELKEHGTYDHSKDLFIYNHIRHSVPIIP